MSTQIENSVPKKQNFKAFKSAWLFIKRYHEGLQVLLSFAGVLLALAGFGAALYAVWTQNQVSRQLAAQQNFVSFYQEWESDEMQERRARLAAILQKTREPGINEEQMKKLWAQIDDSPLVFLEMLSEATNHDLTNYDSTWNAFYYDLTNYWQAVEPYVKTIRPECECFFQELETTSKRFNADAPKKGGRKVKSATEAEAALNRFLTWEVNRLPVKDGSPEVKGGDEKPKSERKQVTATPK